LLAITPDLFSQASLATSSRQEGSQPTKVQKHHVHRSPVNTSGVPHPFQVERNILHLRSWNQI